MNAGSWHTHPENHANGRISNSEGAGVSAQQSHFFSAHSHGFRGGFASSRHSLSVAPIAGTGDAMQRDAWYSSMLDAKDLASPQRVGRYAAERTLSRLGARKITTRSCPVLFESPLAAGLLGTLVQALSGGALYRQSSFLMDSLGKQVLPSHIDHANPYGLGHGKKRDLRTRAPCSITGGLNANFHRLESAFQVFANLVISHVDSVRNRIENLPLQYILRKMKESRS